MPVPRSGPGSLEGALRMGVSSAAGAAGMTPSGGAPVKRAAGTAMLLV
ncbi:hypothetical protein [Modestobacter sp. I12A-02662]